MGEFSTNMGLNNSATKQYAITRQLQQNQQKQNIQHEESSVKTEQGDISNQQLVDMANPNIDDYVMALGSQDEVSKAKKKYQPTVESLKERMERALTERYDNAHNMLAEAFYGFQVSTCNSLLGLLGADPGEMEAIRRKAYEEAKNKVNAGFERLASAYAEFEIYAA